MTIPGLTMGDMVIDFMYDDEIIRNIMEHYYMMMKEFRELEFLRKFRRASKTSMKGYEDIKISEGDLVFYQYQDKKAWLGPEKVFAINGGDVFIFANGNIRKVPRCNVQLCKNGVEIEKGKGGKNEAKVQLEEQDIGNDIEDKDVEVVNKRVTRSMTDA